MPCVEVTINVHGGCVGKWAQRTSSSFQYDSDEYELKWNTGTREEDGRMDRLGGCNDGGCNGRWVVINACLQAWKLAAQRGKAVYACSLGK